MARILVAGAGIGGLAATLALIRAGASVTLLERAPALEEIGAGVQLGPNATRVLGRLGVLDALKVRAVRPDGIRVRASPSGRSLIFLPLRDAEERWGAPYLLALRADLQEALHAAVASEPAATVHLDTALAGFGATSDAVKVTAKQAGIARVFEGDALIGADGIRSTVRARLVDGEDAPQETGRIAWRALIPRDSVPRALRTNEMSLWLGRDAHLVHYPVADGQTINVVAVVHDPTAAATAGLWANPGDTAAIRARFSRWHALARDLIAAAPAWTTWPLFDRGPLANWHAGRIALLGDAAHPVLPFLAQGSALAIEDAATLATAYAASTDLSSALAAYSAARRGRATRVQGASRRLGRIYHLGGPLAAARNIGMRFAGGTRLLAHYDWLYGFDPSGRDIGQRGGLRLTP